MSVAPLQINPSGRCLNRPGDQRYSSSLGSSLHWCSKSSKQMINGSGWFQHFSALVVKSNWVSAGFHACLWFLWVRPLTHMHTLAVSCCAAVLICSGLGMELFSLDELFQSSAVGFLLSLVSGHLSGFFNWPSIVLGIENSLHLLPVMRCTHTHST